MLTKLLDAIAKHSPLHKRLRAELFNLRKQNELPICRCVATPVVGPLGVTLPWQQQEQAARTWDLTPRQQVGRVKRVLKPRIRVCADGRWKISNMGQGRLQRFSTGMVTMHPRWEDAMAMCIWNNRK